MSARITTITPFIDQNLLEEALKESNISFSVSLNQIKLNSHYATFQKNHNGVFTLISDSDHRLQERMLPQIEQAYRLADKKRQDEIKRLQEEIARKKEEERKRQLELQRQTEIRQIKEEQEQSERERKKLEEELVQKQREEQKLKEAKQALVEEQKKKIYEQAKAMGYSVKEKKKGNAVQLVLVRSIY